ncbi:trehalose-6-phosphate synthase [Streptomyces sp. CA-135486]|uniref:trehalose-6-phosphate synthase n=1 Tax=Streptomyces sp. CA-135486 TaxID=3240049 RepID=UPI003D915A5A
MERPGVTVCSNRGPIAFEKAAGNGDSDFTATGPNGLVPVVFPGLKEIGGRWIFAARTEGDRRIAFEHPSGKLCSGVADNVRMLPINLPADQHKQHYETVSVGQLAMLFHYLFRLSCEPNWTAGLLTSWNSFRDVNARFAQTVAAFSEQSPVLVQDYHLLLLAQELRRTKPGGLPPLLYFHHVCWCQPDVFGALPVAVRTEMLQAMLEYDVVGFHSKRWADAFLACCERFLPGVDVQPDGVRSPGQGRETRVITSPAAVDAEDVLLGTRTRAFRTWQDELRRMAAGRWTLGRVDRADLWKNPLRGLLAIEEFLRANPEDARKVWFPAVLTPTRAWRDDYLDYLRDCRRIADRINEAQCGNANDGPVRLFIADDPMAPDRALALALLSVADAFLINPIFDGLNIVAKEGAIISRNDPVVILSENAGIHEEIGDLTLTVNPFDIRQTAESIAQAYRMPAQSRSIRSAEIKRRTLGRDPRIWIEEQLQAIPNGAWSGIE